MSLAEGTSDNEHTRSTQEEDQNSQTPTGTKKKNDKRQVSGIFWLFLQFFGWVLKWCCVWMVVFGCKENNTLFDI